jgi:hypothetical protein
LGKIWGSSIQLFGIHYTTRSMLSSAMMAQDIWVFMAIPKELKYFRAGGNMEESSATSFYAV